MSNLERQQRGLLELIKQRGDSPDDPYLRTVANSRGLVMVRKIALWWRAFELEGRCHFTTRLLKRLGCFHAMVANYFDRNSTSPFVEELSLDFLRSLHVDGDRMIRAMSQFEYALLAVRAGSAEIYEVLWDRHPENRRQASGPRTRLAVPHVHCQRPARRDDVRLGIHPHWPWVRVAITIPTRVVFKMVMAASGHLAAAFNASRPA